MGSEPMVRTRRTSTDSEAAPIVCLVCGGSEIEPFLDLGRTALANRFLSPHELEEPEARFPLRVGFCHGCSHVQLTEHVPPEAMFTNYLYVSSASDTLKAHFAELSDLLVRRRSLGPGDLVIDIGCNDGALLQSFQRLGTRTLGVDPAINLAELTGGSGIDRYTGFFGEASAREIRERWGPAALVTATNTFPHIPDLDDFLRGIAIVLERGGAFVVEAHYLRDLLDQLAFDTVYHEHVSYWALGPMVRLFARHGLEVVQAERLPLHHGQIRVTVQRQGEGRVDESVAYVLGEERVSGLDRVAIYRDFAARVVRLRDELMQVLGELRAAGNRIAGYGAPAKGSTLLEYAGIDADTLSFIADRSPLKQGRYTPGSRIPIVPVERLLEEMPEYVLLLAWNFTEEVLAQQAEYRRRGGRFIVPVPRTHIV